MGDSLRDQLLKAGLVDEKQVKGAKKAKYKKAKQQRHKKAVTVDGNKLQAKRALEEKAARDRELNRKLQEEATQRAIHAQIRQLIEQNRQPKDDGDLVYKFTDNKTIKSVQVSEAMRRELSDGRMAIVSLDERYEIVPAAVAEKVAARDEKRVILHNTPAPRGDEDDPYSEYQVPDDLTW